MQTFNNLPPWVKAIFAFLIITLGIFGYRFIETSTLNSTETLTSELAAKQSNQKRISIIVRNINNEQALPKTMVEITSNGPPVFKSTDNNGYVEITIPTRETLEINLQKEGYKNAKFTLNLETDSDTTKTLYLEPNS